MASVYIIYSKKLKKYYIGSCLDVNKRLSEHQKKIFDDSFTSKADDWILVYTLPDLENVQARNIEEHIKSMKSKKYIENLIKFNEISDRLKKLYKL
jgi:putative endonuclease